MEGKLQGLERVCHQTQGELRILTGKFEVIEEKTKNLETVVQKQAQEVQEIGEDLHDIEEIVENVDNLRKNNIRLKGLPEGAEGENASFFSLSFL